MDPWQYVRVFIIFYGTFFLETNTTAHAVGKFGAAELF
jgi:hypothetical protein